MFPRLTGLIAAPHTPFHADGGLNLAVVKTQASYLAAAGVQGVFVGGSTGESHSLTVDERMKLAERWSDVARGTPLRLVVHVGHNCQRDACELARAAGRLRVNACAALAPSYFKPASTLDLANFLAPIAAAAPDLPFYYYDIPVMTGVTLSVVELLGVAAGAIPNLAGAKFTNLDLAQFSECLRHDGGRFDILSGYDELLLAALALGGRGAVGSGYNFAAPIYRRLVAAHGRGDWEAARREQARGIELIRLLQRYGYFPASKQLMQWLGVDVGPTRSPLRQLTSQEQASLRRDLEEAGLWAEIQPA